MTEIEVAKRVITSYLIRSENNYEAIMEAIEIKSGNKELLLNHIEALINIFTVAKNKLEDELSENKMTNCEVIVMSKLLTKMNLIAIIQQLPEDDIEFVQTYITTLEENNQAMQEELARTWEKLDKKDKAIKEAIDYTKDHIFQFDGDKDFEFLLQILERTDK